MAADLRAQLQLTRRRLALLERSSRLPSAQPAAVRSAPATGGGGINRGPQGEDDEHEEGGD
jgi:hypothetical protein